MRLELNTLDDVKKINKQDFVDNKIDAITIMGVDMTKYGYVGKRRKDFKISKTETDAYASIACKIR